MHPAVPYITRVAGSDYKLPGGNNIIEKGTQVLIPIESIHDDEEYFPNPDVFDPERFNDENKNSIPPYAHMPFGGGPRLCIGKYGDNYRSHVLEWQAPASSRLS
ncbi:hypothetical protein NQ314_020513 [Rhamnusium bicolor]|uniref:Cytochrome P450 n=1 Tax=Rhamnusium bicolor TaxID=1586634 RepID=A0AAV8WLA0_9CUCU|nr:hypothetical protein NQ314_020513 [Rhamnusium bicolor]